MGFKVSNIFMVVFILNVTTHALIDDIKANKGKLNLVQDQSIHILQIVITYLIFYI